MPRGFSTRTGVHHEANACLSGSYAGEGVRTVLGRFLVPHPWLFCMARQNHGVDGPVGVAKTLTLGVGTHRGHIRRWWAALSHA